MTVETVVRLILDGFILLGVGVMTIGVIGIFRMPTLYMKLHAASKSVFLGVCSILIGVIDSGDWAIITRSALIALLLILTTPVAAYEIARAAAREDLRHAEALPAAQRWRVDHDGREKLNEGRLTARPRVERG